MSRVGIMPVPVPPGVEIKVDGREVMVRGPKGQLTSLFHQDMSIVLEEGLLRVHRPDDSNTHRALHGLTRSLLANMVQGVTTGFEKKLEIIGIGYRAQKSDNKLILQLGFSHPVELVPPPTISIEVEGTNRINVIGVDKQLVGEVAARIRAIRPPEPYKGKGIRYVGERVRRKAGKAGKVGAKK